MNGRLRPPTTASRLRPPSTRHTGQAQGGHFENVPVIDDGTTHLTRSDLEELVRWKMGELTKDALNPTTEATNSRLVEADFNPTLHPRGPDGKFIERPWDFDLGLEDISSTDTHRLVEFLGDTDGEPDMDAILSDPDIRIDGIPEDVDSVDELKTRMKDPIRVEDVPANPYESTQLSKGDIILTPRGPAKVTREGSDGVYEVRTPGGGLESFDTKRIRRNTVDVLDADTLAELPDEGEDLPEIPDLPPALEGHNEVPLDVLDPAWSGKKVRHFRQAVADGRIEIGSDLSQDGPLGVDRGVAALSLDMERAGRPTEYGNLLSSGSFDSLQPYMSFDANAEDEFFKDAVKEIQARLPDGYRAQLETSNDGDSAVLRVKNANGDSFPALSAELKDDAREAYPSLTNDEALQKYVDETDLPGEYGIPDSEERAAIDQAFIAGIRAPLSDETLEPLPDTGLGLDDVEFNDDRFEDVSIRATDMAEGDIVRIQPGPVSDRDSVDVGEVVAVRDENRGVTIETPDGETVDAGFGTNQALDAVLKPEARDEDDVTTPGVLDLDDIEPSDPEFNDWDVLEEGDVVNVVPDKDRIDDPKVDDPFVARVKEAEYRGAEPILERANGDEVKIHVNEPLEIPGRYDRSLNPNFEDPDEFTGDVATADDIQTRDLLEIDGSAADRREELAGEYLSDEKLGRGVVDNEELPVGAIVAKESSVVNQPDLFEVRGYQEGSLGDKEIVLRTDTGSEWTRNDERFAGEFRPYKPRDTPEVTIDDADWGDEDDPLAHRTNAMKDYFEEVVPRKNDLPEELVMDSGEDIPEDSDLYETTRDLVAKKLARLKHKEKAEDVLANFRYVAKANRGGAANRFHSNVGNQNSEGWFKLTDDDEAVAFHEFGHVFGYINGYSTYNQDNKGKTVPMPPLHFDKPEDVLDNGMALTPNSGHDDYDPELQPDEQGGYMKNDWVGEVQRQIGTTLDGRNFSPFELDDAPDLEEGDMLYFADEPSYGEPRDWTIVDTEQSDTGFERVQVTLEDREGNQVSGEIKDSFGDVVVSWDEGGFISKTEIQGSRKSTPDDWRSTPIDPDNWLGELDVDDPDEAGDVLADKVNKAFFRQAQAVNTHGERESKDYGIFNGYSALNAHETLSRIHHANAQSGKYAEDPGEMAEVARTLVRYHPDLLEAYRQNYTVGTELQRAVNYVAEHEDIDFRFEYAPMMENPALDKTLKDHVDEIYEDYEPPENRGLDE